MFVLVTVQAEAECCLTTALDTPEVSGILHHFMVIFRTYVQWEGDLTEVSLQSGSSQRYSFFRGFPSRAFDSAILWSGVGWGGWAFRSIMALL